MSIANQHSPRPWRRDDVYGCMVKAGQRYIADTWQLRDTPEERDEDFANACLIVNAPRPAVPIGDSSSQWQIMAWHIGGPRRHR